MDTAVKHMRENPAIALPKGTIIAVAQDYYVLVQSDDRDAIIKYIDRITAERDGMRQRVEKLLAEWQEQLAYLTDLKERGDLTRDWGECSRNNAGRIVEGLKAALSVSDAVEKGGS